MIPSVFLSQVTNLKKDFEGQAQVLGRVSISPGLLKAHTFLDPASQLNFEYFQLSQISYFGQQVFPLAC